MANDYLFTWTRTGWPYQKLKALVDDFEAGKEVKEPWRCMAHRAVRVGDRAYFLKLGDRPRVIFGVGTIADLRLKGPPFFPARTPGKFQLNFIN